MPWWPRTPNFLSSSPSSSSSSPSSPKSYQHQHLQESRRLTRQRKLRHLRDSDIGGVRISPGEAEPEALSKSSSIGNFSSSSRSSFAVPQPLPVPVFSSLLRNDGYGDSKNSSAGDRDGLANLRNSSPGDLPLPSPKEAPSRVAEDRDRTDLVIGEGGPTTTISEGVSFKASIGSRIGYKVPPKGSDHVETRSIRKVPQDRNGVESARENYRLNVPFRSAPTSPYSSPLLSPQGMRRDMFISHYMPTQGLQVWSEPEMPISNTYLGFHSHVSPEKFMFSPDSTPLHGSSPLYSPTNRSPQHNARSPSQPASPLYQKLSCETSTVVRESNGNANNVHPLPLPPGASMPSQLTPIPEVVVKPELVTMTNQWQKGKLIGRGTFGSVYIATNLETGALCAMKEVELFPDDPKSAECIKQMEQEIKVLSHLKHPNIVQYYGSEIVADKFCIYLEYVYPGSINKYVQEHCGAITESVVRNFTRHILCGLAYLHSKKTIHRDIKGANLLVDASGVVKLADFGMAKHLTSQAANLSMKGSPYWMAPELMQAVMQKDTRSDSALAVDIWSLGCTIIEMLNGKPPWSEYEGAAAMFKVLRESPPIPESLSSEGKDFLRCCFRRNPAERPSAGMLLAHRFLKNSQQFDDKSFTQGFNAMKLQDRVHSPRERSRYNLDPLSINPGMQVRRGKVASDIETSQQSHHGTFDLSVASHHSPRSTLEALPGVSPPHSGHSIHHPSPSANGSGSVNHGRSENRYYQAEARPIS